MTNDVNVVGGLIVTAEGSFDGAIGVQGQTIRYIGPGCEIPASKRTINARGWPIRHRIHVTMCRGRVVFEDGDIRGDQGMGVFVTPLKH